MNEKQIKLARKLLARKRYRIFEVRAEHLDDDTDKDKKGRMRFAASSNEPMETFVMTEDFMGRAFEVLSHKEEDVDLKRLRKGGHFLLDHQTSGMDSNLGRIMKADVDGKRLNVDVKFNDENPAAERIENEMKSGMRPNVSIGFIRDDSSAKMVREKDGIPVFEFGFEPFEVSSVLVPADISVGAGRSEKELLYRELGLDENNETHSKLAEELLREMEARPFAGFDDFDDCVDKNQDADDPEALCGSLQAEAEEKSLNVDDDKQTTSLLMEEHNDGVKTRSAGDELEADSNTSIEEQRMSKEITNESTSDVKVTVGADLGAERKRITTIYALAQEDGQLELSIKAVDEGWSVERMKAELHDVAKTGRKVDVVDQPNLDEKQIKELDVRHAAYDYITNKGGSELDDLGREEARKYGINVSKDALVIPLNVPLMGKRDYPGLFKRALGNTSTGQGSALVGTEYFAIAPALFEATVTNRIGVQFHNVKNLAQVPRFETNMPAGFVGEGSSITMASGTFATDTATPRQVIAALGVTPFLGTALDGTYSPVDAILSNMVRKVGEVAERSFWSGSAANEPGGIINNGNVGDTSAATGSMEAYADMWENVRNNSVLNVAPYVVSVDVYRYGLLNAALSSGTEIPTITPDPSGRFSGLTAVGTVQETTFLPAASAVAGDWSQALFFTFGVMELTRDPNTRILSGEDLLWARLFVDNVIQEPAAFTKMAGTIDLS